MLKHLLLSIFNIPDFSNYIQKFGYIGIYIWFISFDQLTPLPEEISLLLVGYLVAHHIFNPILAGIFSIAGFLTIDIAYYFLSRGGSKWLKKHVKQPRSRLINSFKQKLKNHMPRTLVILCFIPRMRLWGPIIVGSLKLPFWKFLLFDTIGLSGFTAIYLTLGVIFHNSLSALMGKMKSVQHIIFIGILIVIAVIIILFVRRLTKDKAEAKK